MGLKERGQRLVVGDTAVLRLFTFNQSATDVIGFPGGIEIYQIFAIDATDSNPLGRVLLQTVDESSIIHDKEGSYSIELDLTGPLYTEGKFQDQWSIQFESSISASTSTHDFAISPRMWFVDTQPIIHDFSFNYSPTRIVKGSKRFISIQVRPSVSKGTDRQRYYENLIYASDLSVSLEIACGSCVPQEADLRLIVDNEQVLTRDGCYFYYYLDSTDLDSAR